MITSLEDFSWLVGVWVGEDGDHIFEEHWSPLRGSSMMGMFRLIQEGQPRFFEFMTLGIEGNECMLRIKHFDPRLIGWEDRDLSVVYSLEESIPGRARFVKRDSADPNWMIYQRENQVLRVHFENLEGEIPGSQFEFRKQ